MPSRSCAQLRACAPKSAHVPVNLRSIAKVRAYPVDPVQDEPRPAEELPGPVREIGGEQMVPPVVPGEDLRPAGRAEVRGGADVSQQLGRVPGALEVKLSP